jgi:8-oxo-dGTP pyrophosphatase MutT (NUDIX family)
MHFSSAGSVWQTIGKQAASPLTKSLRRLPSKLFLFYARFRRGMTLGVRAAVFDRDGRVFLVKHSYVPGWYFPGGGVETGETIEQALHRELLEEGGFVIDKAPELFGLYLNRHASPRDHVALFVCREWRQPSPPVVPNLEIVDCGFFASDALPQGVSDGTKRRLGEIDGTPRSAEW